jgi:hypothetical protein
LARLIVNLGSVFLLGDFRNALPIAVVVNLTFHVHYHCRIATADESKFLSAKLGQRCMLIAVKKICHHFFSWVVTFGFLISSNYSSKKAPNVER